MQHILLTYFEGKWTRLTKTKSSQTVSFLMVHQMTKLLVSFYDQCTLVLCVSMEGSMSCLCFLVTSPNSNPYRLVLYFCFFLLISFSNIFFSCLLSSATCFTMFLDLVPAMEYMPSSLLKLLLSITKKMVYFVVQEPDLLSSSIPCRGP